MFNLIGINKVIVSSSSTGSDKNIPAVNESSNFIVILEFVWFFKTSNKILSNYRNKCGQNICNG